MKLPKEGFKFNGARVRLDVSAPARLFRDLNAEECFATLTELSTFGNKSETPEVHVGSTDDGNVPFLCTNEVIFQDVVL